jgi:uroporphyrinogen-III synthase
MQPVLLTANFDAKYIEQCSKDLQHISIDQQAFISTEILGHNPETQKAVLFPADLWIFTSKKAVQAFEMHYEALHTKPKNIACVGMQTKAALEKGNFNVDFYSPRGSEDLMQQLDGSLNLKQAHFFAGNRHLSFVNDVCKKLDIHLHTHIVYQTTETLANIDLSKYKALLFCSPSAAQSFDKNYKLNQCEHAIFAIGNTTAQSIRNLGAENVLLASEAKLESLLQTADAYFKR